MHRIKGLNVLVKAVDIVAKRFPEVSVKVIGEKGHTTSSRIHFIGPQRGDDLLREISSGSLLALCSLAHTESYPMVLLEAMACRKPVIGTNAGGVPEIITDNVDGLITLSGDEQALAVAIEKILGDEKFANRLAEAGYQKVNERSGWDRKVSQTQEVFSEVSR